MSTEVQEEVYSIKKDGRLNINNSKKFLELLSGTDKDSYEKLVVFGKKMMAQRAADIPFMDQTLVINWAIMKTISGYDAENGANLLTYYTDKLRGEISDYRNKRDSMTSKVHKLAHSEADSYVKTFDKDTNENSFEKITDETPEEIMIAEDIYKRKMQAFRMAYSGIPLYSQYLLNQIVESKLKVQEIAALEGKSVMEINRLRNFALSLILNRVLRSNHLDEEEKDEIKREHGLV